MVCPYWVGCSGVTKAHLGLTAYSALWLIAYCPSDLRYLNCGPYSGYVRPRGGTHVPGTLLDPSVLTIDQNNLRGKALTKLLITTSLFQEQIQDSP